MVSIRRRKLRGHYTGTVGFVGRSSSAVPHSSIPNGIIVENHGQSGKTVNVHHIPSVAINQPVEVKEEKHITVNHLPEKKQKIHVQIDPENPMEVHSYLMQLKEDNKLEPEPVRRIEDMPVKDWMEKSYPHIFSVFPQDPKVFFQFSDKSKQNELLYFHYCIFLYEVRDIVSMDYSASPDNVESLVRGIKRLENQGFDCRFMRSELVVVGYMMRKRQEIMLAERNVIAARVIKLEKDLQAAAIKKEMEAELDKSGKKAEGMASEIETLSMQLNKLQKGRYKRHGKLNRLPCTALEQEYIEVVLERHKEMLTQKEGEVNRLGQVLEKINHLLRGDALLFT